MARPRTYDSVEELQGSIDQYFDDIKKPTITGLAYHLGFGGRQSFYDYENNELFSYTIKRARLKIESEYEARLYEQSCTGAIFALKNLGWKDTQGHDVAIKGGINIIFKKVESENSIHLLPMSNGTNGTGN